MSFERTTPCGVISGTACQWPGIAAYKGIRYATAGRWEFPIPVTHWDGVYDATQYGACCYQPRAFYDEAAAPGKAFYYNEFRKGETYTYSEDCLFLNIWAPAGAAPEDKLPVIFYIHGGGFTGGCGHEKHFDGPVWPTIQFVLEPDSLRKRVRVRFLFIGGFAEGLLGTVNEQRQGITMIVVSCLLLCGIKFALCELGRPPIWRVWE